MNKVTDISLIEDSFVSLHVQLHNQLRQLIHSGRWSNGSRIPSENELTSHLNISRSTIRLALQHAEIEGLIERIAGRGTFVAYTPQKAHNNRLIAFVTGGIDAENHLLMLNGAEREARARGYQIVFSNAKNQEEELYILENVEKNNIAGVILWANAQSTKSRPATIAKYKQIRVPIVLMDRKISGFDCDCVTSNNYDGARALMRHFVDLGHRHIVFLSHDMVEVSPVMERYRAYCEALEEAELPTSEPLIIGQHGVEISAKYALRSSLDKNSLEIQQVRDYLLNTHPRPTALFALNDWIAVFALQAIKQLDLKVPDDISIAGFDDIELAAHLDPPLTTVAQDAFAIGKTAVQLLLDRIDTKRENHKLEILSTELRIRSSTAKVMS